MSYKDNRRELEKAAAQMEHHAKDYHPELDWEKAPKGPSGSVKRYSWTKSADVFVEQGGTYANHGRKK